MAHPRSNGSSSQSASRSQHASISRAFGDDSDSDSERRTDARRKRGRDEALTGYSSTGALKARRSPPPKGPKIIAPVESTGNWWEIRRKRLGLERSHAQELGGLVSMRAPGKTADGVAPTIEESRRNALARPERINDGEQKRGLEVRRRDTPTSREEEQQEDVVIDEPPQDEAPQDEPMDDDERARRALLSGEALGSTSSAALASSKRTITIDETQALRLDAASRPAEPTLADYEAMPIHEFGAALLRGMGWKEGMGAGRNRDGPTTAPEVKKRGHLLGLGAKERANPAPLGIAGKGGAKRQDDRQRDRRYVPLIKRERGEAEGNGSREASEARSGAEDRALVPSRRERERSRSPRRSDDGRERHNRHRESYRERRRCEDDDRDRDRDRERRERHRDGDDRGGRERERDRERDGSTRRHRVERERESYDRRDRDRERERERERERQRERDSHSERDRDGRRR